MVAPGLSDQRALIRKQSQNNKAPGDRSRDTRTLAPCSILWRSVRAHLTEGIATRGFPRSVHNVAAGIAELVRGL